MVFIVDDRLSWTLQKSPGPGGRVDVLLLSPRSPGPTGVQEFQESCFHMSGWPLDKRAP